MSALQVEFLLAGYRHPTTDEPLSGGKVETYLDGTSTLSALWTDKDKGGVSANPVILDSSGKAEVFGDEVYKFRIFDADDVFIEELTGLEYIAIGELTIGTDIGDIVELVDDGSGDGVFPEAVIPNPLNYSSLKNNKVNTKLFGSDGVEYIAKIKNGPGASFLPVEDPVGDLTGTWVEAQQLDMGMNLKPVVNASVNKLDIFTKTGGDLPDSSDFFTIPVPDGNGNTDRTRKAAYLSGTSQFILADASDYWDKGSDENEIKTAWVYAIWDGTGIVWALCGYSGFEVVSTTTTLTDDDYFLLEEGSTYARSGNHFCVAVVKIRYKNFTGIDPDNFIFETVLDSPRVEWNPKSDYGKQVSLATTITSGANIATSNYVSAMLKQSGKYLVTANNQYSCAGGSAISRVKILLDAIVKAYSDTVEASTSVTGAATSASFYINSGQTVNLETFVNGASGNRLLFGDSTAPGMTSLTFHRID